MDIFRLVGSNILMASLGLCLLAFSGREIFRAVRTGIVKSNYFKNYSLKRSPLDFLFFFAVTICYAFAGLILLYSAIFHPYEAVRYLSNPGLKVGVLTCYGFFAYFSFLTINKASAIGVVSTSFKTEYSALKDKFKFWLWVFIYSYYMLLGLASPIILFVFQ